MVSSPKVSSNRDVYTHHLPVPRYLDHFLHGHDYLLLNFVRVDQVNQPVNFRFVFNGNERDQSKKPYYFQSKYQDRDVQHGEELLHGKILPTEDHYTEVKDVARHAQYSQFWIVFTDLSIDYISNIVKREKALQIQQNETSISVKVTSRFVQFHHQVLGFH